eukprot:scaffold123297_cov19-Tisochrysis_lutea.AAC.1
MVSDRARRRQREQQGEGQGEGKENDNDDRLEENNNDDRARQGQNNNRVRQRGGEVVHRFPREVPPKVQGLLQLQLRLLGRQVDTDVLERNLAGTG